MANFYDKEFEDAVEYYENYISMLYDVVSDEYYKAYNKKNN